MVRHPYPNSKTLPIIVCFDATTDELWAALVKETGKVIKARVVNMTSGLVRSQQMLKLIQQVCIGISTPLSVATVVGPAKPGGVRLGVTLANALAFAWQVSVRPCARINSRLVKLGPKLKPGYLRPQYIHPPHITI